MQLPAPDLTAMLDLFLDPIIAIDSDRTVLFANDAATRVLSANAGLRLQRGSLLMSSRDHDERLKALVLDIVTGREKAPACRGFRLPRQSASRDWLATLCPVPGGAGRNPGERLFLLHLVGRIHPRRLPDGVLENLFGLTKKEIGVLHRVALHESNSAIARHLCLSAETVKATLKRIFRKCDVDSRCDLIALLQRIALFTNQPAGTARKYPVGGIAAAGRAGKLAATDGENKK